MAARRLLRGSLRLLRSAARRRLALRRALPFRAARGGRLGARHRAMLLVRPCHRPRRRHVHRGRMRAAQPQGRRRARPRQRNREGGRPMTPEQVLSHKPRVLTQKQREHYFAEGYLLLEKIIPDEWLERLRAATDELIERSRKVTKPDAVWDLEPGHRAEIGRASCRERGSGPAEGV